MGDAVQMLGTTAPAAMQGTGASRTRGSCAGRSSSPGARLGWPSLRTRSRTSSPRSAWGCLRRAALLPLLPQRAHAAAARSAEDALSHPATPRALAVPCVVVTKLKSQCSRGPSAPLLCAQVLVDGKTRAEEGGAGMESVDAVVAACTLDAVKARPRRPGRAAVARGTGKRGPLVQPCRCVRGARMPGVGAAVSEGPCVSEQCGFWRSTCVAHAVKARTACLLRHRCCFPPPRRQPSLSFGRNREQL